nr:MAG TPA: hypothetical protein [Caudoviricetes sp.]
MLDRREVESQLSEVRISGLYLKYNVGSTPSCPIPI